jgi:hypothetical protein
MEIDAKDIATATAPVEATPETTQPAPPPPVKKDKTKIEAEIAHALKDATTPEEVRDALLTLGTNDTLEGADFIHALCEVKRIDTADPELAAIMQQCADWKARQAREEYLAGQEKNIKDTIEQATHYREQLAKGVSPKDKDMVRLAREIAKSSATLNATGAGRERFTSYAEYLNLLRKYDPDNDFTTSILAGLRCPNGTITIIGARPGGGKTSAMINATRETLTNTSRAAFFVNLEMNSRQVLTNLCLSIMYANATPEQRAELVAIEDTIIQFNKSFKWTGKGKYPKHPLFAELQLQAMQKVEAALNEKRLFIYDGIGNTLEGITADIAGNAKEGDVVLLDYIQRTPPPYGQESQNRQVQVQLASRALLNAAIESQCVIIAGAQFNREGEKSGDEATLANFRESGDIEQDAHNAIAIEKEKDTETRYAHVIKEREGGSKYERMELEIVKHYVYWTGGVEYKSSKQTRNKGNNSKVPWEVMGMSKELYDEKPWEDFSPPMTEAQFMKKPWEKKGMTVEIYIERRGYAL